ncbi:MAG: LTA synthase family protein [Halanaerobiaceae bacterium]
MNKWKTLDIYQKYFFAIFVTGFLIKYNYFLLRIFYVPSITGIILRNIIFILISFYIILPFIQNKKIRKILLILYFVFTFIFIANYWYNNYLGNYISFNDIVSGKGAGRFSILEVWFKHILRFYDLIFFLDMILLVYLHRYKSNKGHIFNKKNSKQYVFIPLLIILILLLGQIYITNHLLGNRRPVELYSRSSSEFVNVYGIIPLYIYEAYLNYTGSETDTIEADIPNVLDESKLNSKKILPDNINIMVIQVESLDEKIIDYKYKGKEITPFLNQLKQESIYYENIYSQHVNGSFDADLAFLTSLYPINKNYAFKENDMSKYNSLIKKIKEERGYNSLAFHGNDKTFFHRHQAYPELGFNQFYSRENYSEENKIMEMEESYLGINDYDFLDQTLDYIKKTDTPFFSYIITVTSHTPFNFYPSDQEQNEFEDIENILVRDYFNSIAFTDKALEMFCQRLQDNGILDNTLLIIYGDHESEIKEEEYNSGNEFEMNMELKNPHNIPLFIKYPENEPEIRTKTGTITDIAPTILDLLGIEETPIEFLGNSLLSAEKNPVLFLHEIPQILYRNQLFIKQQDSFEIIGYLQDKKNDIQLSNSQIEYINNIIDYTKNIMYEMRKRE